MIGSHDRCQVGAARWVACAGVWVILVMTVSCSPASRREDPARLQQTASLIEEVKAFGQTLGIKPTDALRRVASDEPSLSMLWLWMQREGTLALRGPVDIRLAIGLQKKNVAPRIEQVYEVAGYSVYYRQGDEFADARSVASVGFAGEPLVRRVTVILHEDLHGDVNFALPWEMEEAIVTPLGCLAAIEYFRQKGNVKELANAMSFMAEERKLSLELMALVAKAETIFATERVASGKQKILKELARFPNYQRQFQRQTRNQHPATVIEAKLSHDLAYYRYFDRIAALADKAPNLRTLIDDLKELPGDATPVLIDKRLSALLSKYGAVAK